MDNGTSRRKPAARRPDSIAAEAAFRKRLDELGATLLESEWLGAQTKHHIRCRGNHDLYLCPAGIGPGKGICITCSGRDPRVAEAEFLVRLAELGCTPLYETYLGRNKPHRASCAAGHECFPRPGQLRLGQGPCRICTGLDSATAEAAFHASIAKMGAVVVGEYRNANTKVEIRCSAGHVVHQTPASVRRGTKICATCSGRAPDVLEARFLAQIAALGATPLYEKWQGVERGLLVRCAAGHESRSRPADVHNGDGICITCAGRDPRVAEATFRARLAELGAELLEPYVNSHTSVRVTCAAGHECKPTPSYVRAGGGICRTCAGFDPAVAETQFRERLAELGAELLVPYVNSATPHHVRCIANHELYVRPGTVQAARAIGRGICVTCAGKGPGVAEAAFRARLLELGAALLEARWLGTSTPHAVQCPQGHLCRPTPANVSQGHGVCRFCAGSEWDCFYVVTGKPGVKFGITTGQGRHRLQIHAYGGYTEVVRLVTGLPGVVALDTENAVKSALALAGEKPVRGREYFDISCLALVLDIADSWLPAEDSQPVPEVAGIQTTWTQGELFAA